MEFLGLRDVGGGKTAKNKGFSLIRNMDSDMIWAGESVVTTPADHFTPNPAKEGADMPPKPTTAHPAKQSVRPPLKPCVKCWAEKPFDEFLPNATSHDGLSPRCNQCADAVDRNRRLTTKRCPSTQVLDAKGYDWAWAFVVYREIPGYDGYMVGSDGTIWSRRQQRGQWRARTLQENQSGYFVVVPRGDDGAWVTRSVHRLVLEAFIGLRPPSLWCRHMDGNPKNNSIYNIKWDTVEANMADKRVHSTGRRGERQHNAKLTEADVRTIRAEYAMGRFSCKDFAARYRVSVLTIKGVVDRKSWKHVQ